LKHHQFASSFEQQNFISHGTFKGKEIENPIYYVPFLFFKIVVTHLVAPFIVFAPNRVVSRFENL
jgi:hypothetical protein